VLASTVVATVLLGVGQAAPRFDQLDNGLRVVVVEDHARPLVSVQLWYRVGSACDPSEQPGLCAVSRSILAHSTDAAWPPDMVGVHSESRTERDACCFSSVLPPNLLEHALDLEAARLAPLSVTVEALQQGLRAAAGNWAERADDPNQIITGRVLAAMFPEHPYERPPEYVGESLNTLTANEVTEFMQRWFRASNATLLVIGDVSTVQVLDLAHRKFGGLKLGESTRRAEPTGPEAETRRVSISGPRGVGVTIAWRTPPLGYFENAAIDVLMHELCNPVDGRLHQELVESGYAPPRWQRHAWRDEGLLMLSVDLPTGSTALDAERIEDLISAALPQVARDTPPEIRHNRARALAQRAVLERVASFAGQAYELAAHEVIAGDILLAGFATSRVRSVSVYDVQLAARNLSEARTVILRRSVSSRCDGVTTLDDARSPASQPSVESSEPPVMSERPETEAAHDLGNGVHLRVRALRGNRLAEVRTLVVTPRPPTVSLQALFDAGSTRHSAAQIRDYLSYHGLDLSPFRRDTRVGLRSRGPTSHVAQMIELQSELLRFPARAQAAELGQTSAVELLVTGDVDAADVLAAARAAWGDWRAPERGD
jgi:zinc protease